MNAQAIEASIDARVLSALHDVPDSDPIERVAEVAGVDAESLRRSMRRLALRDTPGLKGSASA